MNDLEAATDAINDLNLNSCKSMDNIVNVASGRLIQASIILRLSRQRRIRRLPAEVLGLDRLLQAL
jgi:hypothetical protein